MSEHTKNIVVDAVFKFFEAFRQLGFPNSYPAIQFMAALLYMMKKGYVTKQTNVSATQHRIISIIDLQYMQNANKNVFEEWKKTGVYNQALLLDYPENDPMAESISNSLSFVDTRIGKAFFVFEFFNTLSEVQKNNLFYLEVLDIALTIFTSNLSAGQYSQPVEFAQLASAMVDSNGKTIYNPFSGLMSFATSMKEYMSFTGVERDSVIAEISKFRIHLADIQNKVDCIHGDAVDWTDDKYNIIVSNPPFGLVMSAKGESKPIKAEWLCLKKFEESTSSDGVLFTYVIPSVLYDSSRYKEIRHYITEKNYLDTVILLPANLLRPYTSISLVVILLKKNRSKGDSIKMIDASEMIKGDKKKPILDVEAIVNCIQNPDSDKRICVTQDEIRHNDYNWSVSKYLAPQNEIFPEGYKVVNLGEVVELIRGERHFKDSKGHLVQISGLATNVEDCIRTVDSFEISSDLRNATKIVEPVVLLSSIRVLKPTYCNASPENPIFLHPNVVACRIIQDWVSPAYLCLELSRRFIHVGGNFIPRISHSDLKSMKLAFPSIGEQRSVEEQNNLYKEAVNNSKLAKVQELGLQEIIEQMKTDYINEIRSRKHDMMPHLRQVSSACKNLDIYMMRKDDMSEKEFMEGIKEEIVNQKRAIETLTTLLKVFSREEEFGTPEVINIDKFLGEFCRSGKNYYVQYEPDYMALDEYGFDVPDFLIGGNEGYEDVGKYIENVNVFIAPDDLVRLCSNIINNAVVHGFTDPSRTDYYINIILTIDNERDMYEITFSNNGTPFPKGFDKLRYGIRGEKAGKTAGSGEGGHTVKSIVEHYGGDYDIFCGAMDFSGAEFDNNVGTTVIIHLPIYKNDE